MMSEANLSALEAENIKYVIAAKLKKTPQTIQEKLFQKDEELISIKNEQHYKLEHLLPNGRIIKQ